jgi:DGQHR domain-containing protein
LATKVTIARCGDRCFFVAMPTSMLKDLYFISRFDKEDMRSPATEHHGYQRPPTEKRYASIAKYYSEEGYFLLTPIIVSVRIPPEATQEFIAMIKKGQVDLIKKKWDSLDTVFSIVDGQHRAHGFFKLIKDDPNLDLIVPCFCITGMDFADETESFNSINTHQKRLPKALVEINKSDITDSGIRSYAQSIRELAALLCRHPDSVWGPDPDGNLRVNMTGNRDPKKEVTFEGLRRSTSNMFPKSLHERLTYIGGKKFPLKIAKEYWLLVSQACDVAWDKKVEYRLELTEKYGEFVEEKIPVTYRIKELVGIASLAKLGASIVQEYISKREYEPDIMEKLVAKLSAVDWEKREDNPWMSSGAGFAGQKVLHQQLFDLVFFDKLPETIVS